MPSQPLILPIGEWMPDAPPLAGGCSVASGVVPLTKDSYGPVGSFSPYADALTDRCQGEAAIQDLDGNVYLFAGDAGKLYMLTAGATAYTDVSRLSGGAYSTGLDQWWCFAIFGNRVFATNGTDTIQTMLLPTDTEFQDLTDISSGTPPRCRYLRVVRDFLVAFNTYDAVSGNQQQRVWWPAIGDPLTWPTPGTTAAAEVQSDYQDIPGDFGWIMGAAGPLGSADCVAVMERGVQRIQYIGSPAIFDFQPALGARGTPAPGSIIQRDNIIYYLSDEDFYAFDGLNSKPLGMDKWAKAFFADLDVTSLLRIQGTIDPQSKLVLWGYPTLDSGSLIGRVLAYNWSLDRASQFDLSCEFLGRSLSLGLTLDELGNLDQLLFPLDSRAYMGGKPLISCFNTDHRLGYLYGDNLAVTIETPEKYVVPGQRIFVRSSRPMTDGGTPSVALGVRDRLQDSVTYGTATAMNAIGACPQRISGRYLRARLTLSAGETFTHIEGVELEGGPAGSR